MARPLTIVMYHYVREVASTRFPGIKARSIAEFRVQLDHAKRQYTPVTMEQVIDAIRSPDSPLPERAILLTFDDGYVEHYETVFPLLVREGIQGSFFPPARPIVERSVLDVNKLHFVLARSARTDEIVRAIFDAVNAHRAEYGLDEPRGYWDRLAIPNRFDSGDVVFVKRMLQRELPESIRRTVLARLFAQLVAASETDFANELYMTAAQIREMRRAGMFVGSHGHSHHWMDRLTVDQQVADLDASMAFLRSLDCLGSDWAMCYPYGAWNDELLAALRRRNCSVGLTTRVAVADLDDDQPLTLPRLDTNDLPVSD